MAAQNQAVARGEGREAHGGDEARGGVPAARPAAATKLRWRWRRPTVAKAASSSVPATRQQQEGNSSKIRDAAHNSIAN